MPLYCIHKQTKVTVTIQYIFIHYFSLPYHPININRSKTWQDLDHSVLLSKTLKGTSLLSFNLLNLCLLSLPALNILFTYQQDIRIICLLTKVYHMSHHHLQVHPSQAKAHVHPHPIILLLIPCHLPNLQHHITT